MNNPHCPDRDPAGHGAACPRRGYAPDGRGRPGRILSEPEQRERGRDPASEIVPAADPAAPEPVAGTAPGWLDRLAMGPGPLLVLAMVALYVASPPAAYPDPWLLLTLNLVFSTLVSFLVAYLGMRGFVVAGEPGLLLLACGAEIWGTGAVLASVAGWGHPNVVVTVHNGCALLSGACHAAGAVAARRPRRTVRDVDGLAATALGAGVLVPALIAGAALEGLTPTFFVQGEGGTPVREVVLGAAVVLFAAAAALLGVRRPALTRFTRFYALALALVAAGLAGVLFEPTFGGVLGWTARATQYLGGVYMLVAAVVSVRETRGWELSLQAGLADARTRLRLREARYRAFFENLREAVALYEPVRGPGGEVVDWIVREANDLYARALGVSRERVLDRRVGETVGPEKLAEWSREWRQVLETGEPLAYERIVGEHAYLVSAFRMDADTVAATALDVTERRRTERALQESERLYRAIGESIDYGVWVCAPDGRNVYASESFLRLVGLTQRQCSDFGWGDVLHPDDAARTIAAWKECVATGGAWDIEHRFKGVDGRWHPILARGAPVRDEAGRITCWAGINLDIARLKDAEQRLRDVGPAQETSSSRSSPTSSATRSRRCATPSTSSRTAPPESPQAARARDVIERQVRPPRAPRRRPPRRHPHLPREGDARAQAPRPARDRHPDLRGSPRPARASVGSRSTSSVGEPAFADADPTRIAQVLGNLLQNAAKFTPEGGNVAVTLGTARRPGRSSGSRTTGSASNPRCSSTSSSRSRRRSAASPAPRAASASGSPS